MYKYMCISLASLASQTPPLFEIGRRGRSLVNRVDFSVPAKEFGRRCWYENENTESLKLHIITYSYMHIVEENGSQWRYIIIPKTSYIIYLYY